MSKASPQLESSHPNHFADTRWSVVLLASEGNSPDSRAALETFCRTYWRPLYGFVRRSGWNCADAQDLVQGFLVDFLARNTLAEARPELGRFRTLLLACLKNYLANQAKRSRRVKRGGGQPHVPWEDVEVEAQVRHDLPAAMTPEEHYDREWALALLDLVFERLRRECENEGKGDVFERLRDFLSYRRTDLSYEEVGESLGKSAGNVRVIVHRFRKRFRDLLREEVGRTIFSPSDLEDEIKALIGTLSR